MNTPYKYAGSQLLGDELFDSITKQELAAVAFYFAKRFAYNNEKDAIIEEIIFLRENGILPKKNKK